MKKNDFLKMMKQDLETKNDSTLKQLLCCFEEVLKSYSDETEIESTKTVEDCYKDMTNFARQNAQNNSFCFGPSETKKFIEKYLCLKESQVQKPKNAFINLEDFI